MLKGEWRRKKERSTKKGRREKRDQDSRKTLKKRAGETLRTDGGGESNKTSLSFRGEIRS